MPSRLRHLKACPRQPRSEETLRALLDATTALLERHHFEDIGLSQILDAAGVSVGSFYARFHSKEDLLPHLYQLYSDGLRERTSRGFLPERWRGVNLAGRLQGLLAEAVASYRQHRGLLRTVALLARARPRLVSRSSLRERDGQYAAASALLLECRAEIRHPEPDLAVRTAILFALAACRDKILFAEAPHPASVNISDERLVTELTRAMHAYLTTQQP